jgi:hypothetical protein
MIELKWTIISCLERLVMIDECLEKVNDLILTMEEATIKSIDHINKLRINSLNSLLTKKRLYLKDYLDNKQEKIKKYFF